MSIEDVPSFTVAYARGIDNALSAAGEVKDSGAIEPPLTTATLGSTVQEIEATRNTLGDIENTQAHSAAIEVVVRERFYGILGTTSIDEPAFGQIWNLLDIVSLLSDHELCEAGLMFRLVEELLDSQTIDGCGIIFDFLESRRERITAKHFSQKNLIILRSCNELLRRLSRAEDIVFCGRVFIFLFQSFPLGDKSSVNLRGEFHTENVTVFDEIKNEDTPGGSAPVDYNIPELNPKDSQTINEPNTITVTTQDPGSSTGKGDVDLDELYPVFWSLQADFSAPTRLFEPKHLEGFKTSLAETLDCFQKVSVTAGSSIKVMEEPQTGEKRKHGVTSNGLSSAFNPKYLTSRDLFELEIHDIAFRRHVLVQALIVLDFLLSLTAGVKAKLAELTNRSVLYQFTLSDDDTRWASSTKSAIAQYLQQAASNGKFYYRMVDTVLSRDRNWVRWKAENCPEIQRPPINTQQHQSARGALQRACKVPELSQPLGALDFSFLTKDTGLDGLKDPARYTVPSTQSFYSGILNDELDAEMGTEEEMQLARDAKETKIWKALRASSNRFQLCESIDNNKNLKAFSGSVDAPDEEMDTAVAAG